MKMIKMLTLFLMFLGLVACNQVSKDQLKQMLKDNPDILTDAILANPSAFLEAMQTAVKSAQEDMAKKREESEKKEFEESFSKPLVPEIRKDEFIQGVKDGPLTIVEYSDFECPYCSRGYKTVKAFEDKYAGKVKFIFKHLPLSFHNNAMISAQYYEAIRLQDPSKARKFHDTLFENQQSLQQGEAYLKSIAKGLKVDMKKLETDISSEAVLQKIEEDKNEAAKFGMQGTPGFVLNGIPIRGAYPLDHFVKIVDELKKRGMVNL